MPCTRLTPTATGHHHRPPRGREAGRPNPEPKPTPPSTLETPSTPNHPNHRIPRHAGEQKRAGGFRSAQETMPDDPHLDTTPTSTSAGTHLPWHAGHHAHPNRLPHHIPRHARRAQGTGGGLCEFFRDLAAAPGRAAGGCTVCAGMGHVAGQTGWPPGEALRLARLRERALRDRAKTRRAAVDATRGRLLALLPLLRKERSLRPDCELLGCLAGRVEKALADAAPLGVGEELRELLRVELAAERDLKGMLERLRGCLRPLLALEWELLRALEKGRAAPAPVVARAEVAQLEARLRDRRAEAELRRALAEAADEEDLVERNRKAGVHEAEAGVRAAEAAWWALVEGPEPAAGDRPAWEAQLDALEEEKTRAEQALSEAEERADALLDETVEDDLEWLSEWLSVDPEIWWERIWEHLEGGGTFGMEWERWARAVDAVSCAEYSLEEAQEELERLETARAVA